MLAADEHFVAENSAMENFAEVLPAGPEELQLADQSSALVLTGSR